MQYLSVRESRRQVIYEEWFDLGLLPRNYQSYFTVEYEPLESRWVINTNSYIGIIPLSDEYAIQINPKSGLTNITYILHRSGLLSRSLETPFDQTVYYDIPDDDLESFFEGLVMSFLASLDDIKRWGLMRETQRTIENRYSVRGKIDYRLWARSIHLHGGIPIPQHVFSSNLNNTPNRVLRYCLEYLMRCKLTHVNLDTILGRLEYFDQIPTSSIMPDEVTRLEHIMDTGQFPSDRYYYLPALNLALLILRGAGLAMTDQQEVVFKPILINTATMFEKYMRVLCQEAVKPYDAHADDGKLRPKPFYKEPQNSVPLEPDILIRRAGLNLVVVDAKYKLSPTAQDHYQMWAYLHGFQVKRGGFLSVADPSIIGNRVRWYNRDDYTVFDYAFDCQAIQASEVDLKTFIAAQLTAA